MNVLENFKNLFLDVWQEGVSGINISEIIIALIIFIFFLFLRGVFSKFVVKRLEKYVSKTTNKFEALVNAQFAKEPTEAIPEDLRNCHGAIA